MWYFISQQSLYNQAFPVINGRVNWLSGYERAINDYDEMCQQLGHVRLLRSNVGSQGQEIGTSLLTCVADATIVPLGCEDTVLEVGL